MVIELLSQKGQLQRTLLMESVATQHHDSVVGYYP